MRVTDDEFAALLAAWFGNAARVLRPGGGFYVWGGYANVANYPPALRDAGLYFSQVIIWVKEHPVLTRKDFMGNHEWCFYGWREGAAHRYLGPPNVPDVWSVKKVSPNAMVHLTEKPVELSRLAVEYSSLRVRRCSTRSRGRARRSSRPSRPAGVATAWSWTRSTAT